MLSLIPQFRDYFQIAIKGIKKRKLRSWLTMLGIFVGIAAVVGLISISKGMESAIKEEFNTIGADRVIVQPGSAFFGPPGSSSGLSKITKHDLDLIEGIRGVSMTAGYVMKTTRLEFNDKTKFVFGIGLPPDENRQVFGSRFDIIEGRQFRKNDGKVAIIGNSYSTDPNLVGKTVNVGDTITVENQQLKVIGIRKKLGDPTNDVSIMIPIETLWDIYGGKDEYSAIMAEVEEGFKPSDVADKVKDAMRKDRHEDEGNEDFQVQTSEELFASFATILNIVQAVIVGIAAISLIVGSIGVMNTMYTSVLERTREIGVMKAIGAKNNNILLLFLIESGMYGLVGGLIGIIFGIGMAKMIEFAATNFLGSALLKANSSPTLLIGALLFSFLLGAISGAAPARQASRLNPVKALRYE